MKHILLIFLLGILISACEPESMPQSSSSSGWPASGQNVVANSQGLLLDSAVEGLRYKSGAHYGVTDSDGRFGYILGENIEFYIGYNLIASADTPKELLTPYEFSSESPFPMLDVLRLLQSLDDDGDPNNGIQITEDLHLLAESVVLEPRIDFNFPGDYIDPDVIFALTSTTFAGARGVVTAYDAYFHFANTLGSLIYARQVDIQSLADQTTCTSSDQCAVTELKTSDTYYCPSPGPSIIYSTNDIDQEQFDILVAEREYWIDANSSLKLAVVGNDVTTSFCSIQINVPEPLVCNVSNRCE